MPGPQKFTSKTPLPRKIGGSDYPADTSGGSDKNANPGAVKRYGVFHNHPFEGVPEKNEKDPYPMKSSGIKPSLPEGVDKNFKRMP